jgi:hypothetical protein
VLKVERREPIGVYVAVVLLALVAGLCLLLVGAM